MNSWTILLATLCVLLLRAPIALHAEDTDAARVKSYLVETVTKMEEASDDFVKHSEEYASIIASYRGDYETAYAAQKHRIAGLVDAMRQDYKAMDSYGYESVEGIVAGVPSLAAYDVYLDAGVPESVGPDNVSPLVLDLGAGEKIERQGSTFTYIIEPALWGGDPRWVRKVDLDGDGTIGSRESLPRAELVVAAAKDTEKKIGELLADAKAWNATIEDCFGAMVAMTPTLSDYFEDWRESRYADTKSGRFQAVSRISDMRGIMASCAIMYDAVKREISLKDKALAKATKNGFNEILKFLDMIEKREKAGAVKASEIDELAEQAKAKTDKLVPQIEQAAAVLGIQIAG